MLPKPNFCERDGDLFLRFGSQQFVHVNCFSGFNRRRQMPVNRAGNKSARRRSARRIRRRENGATFRASCHSDWALRIGRRSE